MASFDFQTVEAAYWELERQAQALEIVHGHIKELAGTTIRFVLENTSSEGKDIMLPKNSTFLLNRMKDTADSLGREIHSLRQAAETLHRILVLYKRAEKRVLDTVQGEVTVIPRTVFGTSYFQNLRTYKSLIPDSIAEKDISGGETVSEDMSVSEDTVSKEKMDAELRKIL